MKRGNNMTRLRTVVIWLIPIFGILILSGLCLSTSAFNWQQQATPPPIIVENVRDNIYLVKGGSGANCYFLAGDKTNLLFDAKMSPDSMKEMLSEIQKISPRPLSMVILTHSDGDHTNGLPGLPEGTKIISHKKAFEEMLPAVEKSPELKKFLPSETYEDRKKLDFEGTKLELRNFGPAHTSGDTIAIIPTSKVAIVGDLVFIGRDPLIHQHKNGSFYGLIKTLESLLAYKPEIELFLSGHADPVGREEVISLLNTLKQTEARVREMIQQNKTLEEIKAAFGLQLTSPPPRRPPLVEIIYQEIMAKK
ncbi:MAG: MBL fold metallo-hydrolase [Acidobacteriota bacterium]|nr:MBL fold metallo-hydrolase [Acidobacteriota bacterium]MDW3228541.1 MBL fold metallo-hydrolase [Acidobacteriota bacterium]